MFSGSLLFCTCDQFWHLILFCRKSSAALLLEISLISFLHSAVATVIVEIAVALRGLARGNAHLGFILPVNPTDAREAGEHLVLPEIHLNDVLQLWGCWGSRESLLQPRAERRAAKPLPSASEILNL